MNFQATASTRVVSLLITLTLMIGPGCAPPEPVGDSRHTRYVVGISPFLDEADGDEVFRHVARLLLEDMPLNSSLWIYDAHHIKTIARFEIPNRRAFESGRTRANQFSDSIRLLKSFLATPNEPPVVSGLGFKDSVQLPQFLDFLGENLNQTNMNVVALVLGSPLYQDEKEPAFSMVDDYFPSDGHLSATREKSVYGRKDHPDLLKDITVHLGYFGDPWSNELHRQKVSRFWNLFLQAQGARLATLTGDLPTIFNALCGQPPSSGLRAHSGEPDPAQTKIEMLRVSRDVQLSDWITRDLPSDHRPPSPTVTVGPMKIGIRWRGELDLDLYASAREEAETLFFQHTRAPEGYYYKDHRSSPDQEYEFIEFTEPVDVRQVRAHVNFYEGAVADGPRGEVRIEFQGRIYSGRFKLAAENGNQGREGRSEQDYWRTIDIPHVLGLR